MQMFDKEFFPCRTGSCRGLTIRELNISEALGGEGSADAAQHTDGVWDMFKDLVQRHDIELADISFVRIEIDADCINADDLANMLSGARVRIKRRAGPAHLFDCIWKNAKPGADIQQVRGRFSRKAPLSESLNAADAMSIV